MRVTAVPSGSSSARRLDYEVSFDDGETRKVYFEWTGPPLAVPPCDAILPAVLPGAIGCREDLHIDGPVSASLLAAVRDRALPTFVGLRSGYEPIRIHASELVGDEALPPAAPGVALQFSGGLDSTYSLVRNRDRLTHLVYVHGFDLGVKDREIHAHLRAERARIASEHGLELLGAETRIRTSLYRIFQRRIRAGGDSRTRFLSQWAIAPLLVGLGQLFAGAVGRLVVAASWDGCYEGALSSHPDLEPAFGTPRLAVELDGADASRPEKALYLAEHAPDRLRGVRVCARRPYSLRNCGRCWKCVRLRMELRVAGIPPELHPFDAPLSDWALRRSFVNPDAFFWPEILRLARERGDRRATRTAEIIMEQRFHLGRELQRLLLRGRRPGWVLRRDEGRGVT